MTSSRIHSERMCTIHLTLTYENEMPFRLGLAAQPSLHLLDQLLGGHICEIRHLFNPPNKQEPLLLQAIRPSAHHAMKNMKDLHPCHAS